MAAPAASTKRARGVSAQSEVRLEADLIGGRDSRLRDFIGGLPDDGIRGAWSIAEPSVPFKPNWHIDRICEHLEAVTAGEIRRLLINIPPRHMKSLAVAVFWPVWEWTFDPHVRWLFSSYALTLAKRDSVKCRRIIDSPWFQDRWGAVFQLSGDQNEKLRFENDQSGYRIATSVGGSATGEGGDRVVVDDPHKVKEVESELVREEALEWWDQTMSTRLNDPATGARVIVMQRIHERDLSGHVIDRGGYTHLCLPAEYEPAHPFVWPDDPRVEPGELLWPDHFGAGELEELKTDLGSYAAAGQLQQRPAPAEGGILKTSWWRYFDPENLDEWRLPPLVSLCASWDTALKAKTSNDYTVGTLWGARGADRFLLRRFRDRVGLPDTKTAVRTMAAWADEHFPGLPLISVVENAANGPEVVAELRDKVQGLILNTAKGDKVTRAHAVSPQLEAGNVFVPGFPSPDGSGPDTGRTPAWVQELVVEHASFPNGAHDDQVDSTTQALTRMRGDIQRVPRGHVDDRTGDQRQFSAGIADEVF